MDFRKLNNLTGWIIFGIAALVYLLTVEEVASYWDAGEFIAVSYRRESIFAPFFRGRRTSGFLD